MPDIIATIKEPSISQVQRVSIEFNQRGEPEFIQIDMMIEEVRDGVVSRRFENPTISYADASEDTKGFVAQLTQKSFAKALDRMGFTKKGAPNGR